MEKEFVKRLEIVRLVKKKESIRQGQLIIIRKVIYYLFVNIIAFITPPPVIF